MTNMTRCFSLIGILSLTFAPACAAPEDDDGTSEPEEETAQVEQAVACSSSNAATQQENTTKAFKYVLGGTSNPASGSFGNALTSFRTKISSGKINVYSPVAATVCGRKAAKARVVALDLTLAEANQLKALGSLADSAWGSGASNFLYVDGTSIVQLPDPPGSPKGPARYSFTAWFDPEPAKLTQSLSGSTGATAAAVYANSNASTSVIKWLSTPAAGSAAAGTPCTTGDASINTETTRVIQVLSSGYKRCL